MQPCPHVSFKHGSQHAVWILQAKWTLALMSATTRGGSASDAWRQWARFDNSNVCHLQVEESTLFTFVKVVIVVWKTLPPTLTVTSSPIWG
jgi:hypothetical protein